MLVLKTSTQQPSVPLEGELIEADDTRVRLLTAKGLVTIREPEIKTIELQIFAPNVAGPAIHTTVGFLGTASHGAFLIFTAPLWILTGSLSTAAETRAPKLTYPKVALSVLRPFARFPQGYPAGLAESDLGPLTIRPEERPPKAAPASPAP